MLYTCGCPRGVSAGIKVNPVTFEPTCIRCGQTIIMVNSTTSAKNTQYVIYNPISIGNTQSKPTPAPQIQQQLFSGSLGQGIDSLPIPEQKRETPEEAYDRAMGIIGK